MGKWMAGCILALALAGCSTAPTGKKEVKTPPGEPGPTASKPAATPAPVASPIPSAAAQAPDKDPFAKLEKLAGEEDVADEEMAECERIIAENQDNPLVLAKALHWKANIPPAAIADYPRMFELFDQAERLLADARVPAPEREEEQAQIDVERADLYGKQGKFDKAHELLLRVINNENLPNNLGLWKEPQDAVPPRCDAVLTLGYFLARRTYDPEARIKVMAELVEKYPGSPVAGTALVEWSVVLRTDRRYRESQEKLDQAAAILGKENSKVRFEQGVLQNFSEEAKNEKPGYGGRWRELHDMIAAWDKSDDPVRDFIAHGAEYERSGLEWELWRNLGKEAAKPYLVRACLELSRSAANWPSRADEGSSGIWEAFRDAGQLPLLRETVGEFAKQNAADARALAGCACLLNPMYIDNPPPLSPLFDDALKVAKDNGERAPILLFKAARLCNQNPGEAAELYREFLALPQKQDDLYCPVAGMLVTFGEAGKEAGLDECLAKCLEWVPNDAFAIHCLAGRTYQQMGLLSKAEAQYRLTLETLSSPAEFWNVAVRIGLAAVLTKEGKTKEARSVAEEALTWAERLADARGEVKVSCRSSFFPVLPSGDFRACSVEMTRRRLQRFMDVSDMTLGEIKKRAAKEAPLPPQTDTPLEPPGYLEREFRKPAGITGGAAAEPASATAPAAAPQATDKDPFADLEAYWNDEESDFDSIAECDRIIAANQNNPLVLAKALRWKGTVLTSENVDYAQKVALFDKAERLLADARVSDAEREEEQAQIDIRRADLYRRNGAFDKAQKLLLGVVENEHLQTIEVFRVRQGGEDMETVKIPVRCWALMSLGYTLQMQTHDPDVSCKVMAELVEKYPGTPVAGKALLCWAEALRRDQRYREEQEKLDQAFAILGKENWLVRDEQEWMEHLRNRMAQEKPGYQGRYKELCGMLAAWDKSDDPLRDFNRTGDEGERLGLVGELCSRLGKVAARPYLLRAYLDLARPDWSGREIWQSFKDAGQLPLLRETVTDYAKQHATDARALAVSACLLSQLDWGQNPLAPLSPLFDAALKVAKNNDERVPILRIKAQWLRTQNPGEAAELYRESLALAHEDPYAAGQMIEALEAAGKEAELDECLAKCLEWFPRDAYVIHCLAGRTYQQMGLLSKAEAQYRLTLETLSSPAEFWNVAVRIGLAAVLTKEGKTKEARSVAEEALTWAERLADARGEVKVSCRSSFFPVLPSGDFRACSVEMTRRRLQRFMDVSDMTLGEIKKRAAKEAPLPPQTDTPLEPPGYLEREFRKPAGITGAVAPAAKPAPQTSLTLQDATDADLAALKGWQDLKELDLSESQVTDTGLAYLVDLKGLISLNLRSTQVTDAGLEKLAGMKGLQTLNLYCTKVTDAGLVYLKKIDSLQKLDLRVTAVTEAGVEQLSEMQGLRSLDLVGIDLTDAGLARLKGLKGLQTLRVSSRAITDAGLAHLREMKGLQELSLHSGQITDAGLAYLKDLKSLRTLDLGGPRITNAGMAQLVQMAGLQSLHLNCRRVTDIGFARLEELKNLQELGLGGLRVTDASLTCLKEIKGLQKLCLEYTGITDAGMERLAAVKGLQVLKLYGNELTGAGLAFLKGLNSLQEIGLSYSTVTDAGLASLEELKGLKSLDLSGTQVTDAGLVHLRELKGLQTLNLWDTQVTDAGLAELKQMTGLQELYLSQAGVTDAGLAQLAEMKGLKKLSLALTQVTDAGLAHLKGMKGLRKLYLWEAQVTAAELADLRAALPYTEIPSPPAPEKFASEPSLLLDNVTDADLAAVKDKKELRSLNLRWAGKVTDAGWACLEEMTDLRNLRLDGAPVTDAALGHLAALKNLQSLDLGGTEVSDAGLARLKGLTGLQELDLVNTKVTDAGLALLKEMKGLRTLDLDGTKVTDAGLENLAEMKSLVRIYLSDTEVSDAGLAHLKGLTSLQVLYLSDTKVTDAGVACLKEMKDLQRLSLTNTQVTSAGLAHLKQLAVLRMLALGQTQVTDAGLAYLSEMQYLDELDLEGTRVTDAGLAYLKDTGDLRYLNLSKTQVTDAGLAHLEGINSLTDLKLGGARITDAGLAHLKGLRRMERLDLSDTQVTDAGLVHLKDMERLSELYLSKTQVTNAGLVHLKGLKRLSWVDLRATRVTDAGLADLEAARPDVTVKFTAPAPEPVPLLKPPPETSLTLPRATDADLTALEDKAVVRNLNLAGSAVTDGGLAQLKEMTALETLDLSKTKVGDAGLAHLKDMHGLRQLDLRDTLVTDAGLVQLEGMQDLQRLNLSRTHVTDAGLTHLRALQSLQELDLDCITLTGAGLACLKDMKSLRTLDLWGARLTDADLEHLKELKGLQTLDLSGAAVTDAGVACLKGMDSLQELALSWTKITGAGLVHLTALKGLEKLALVETHVTDAGMADLKKMKSLKTLDLRNTQVTDAGLADLKAALPNTQIYK